MGYPFLINNPSSGTQCPSLYTYDRSRKNARYLQTWMRPRVAYPRHLPAAGNHVDTTSLPSGSKYPITIYLFKTCTTVTSTKASSTQSLSTWTLRVTGLRQDTGQLPVRCCMTLNPKPYTLNPEIYLGHASLQRISRV